MAVYLAGQQTETAGLSSKICRVVYSRQVEAHSSLGQVKLFAAENTPAAATDSPVADEWHKCRQVGILLHY